MWTKTHSIARGLCQVSKAHTILACAGHRRSFGMAATLRLEEKDNVLKGNHYTKIPHRSLLELEGPDCAKFLQGLITNHMPLISAGGDGFFSAFLTPQGRLAYDTFIYPVNVGVNFPHPKFIIDCASSEKLQKHLVRYLLRSKVKVRDVTSDYTLYSIWGAALDHHATSDVNNKVPSGALVKKNARLTDIGCVDPRVPGFGYRAVLPNDQDMSTLLSPGDFSELAPSEYTIRRILHGIPEGPDDLWPEQSLPLESNFDLMNAVDFRKGCYVGQELTIRTYHTGVVRKRIVPIQIYKDGEMPPQIPGVDRQLDYTPLLHPQMDIKMADASVKRAVGKIGSHVHNVGLALMRLEQVQQCANDNGATQFVLPDSGLSLRPFLPEWWREVNQ